jgi:phospho-N-acetylmuramoyl-pentapeptide-transferase
VLVNFFLWFKDVIPGVNVVRYLSFRIGAAALTTFLLTLILIPLVAKLSQRLKFGDRKDKSDSNQLNDLHSGKRNTPILGGLAILVASFLTLVMWSSLSNFYVLLVMLTIVSLGLCGFVDDYVKTFGQDKHSGLTPRQKLLWQITTAVVAAVLLVQFQGDKDGFLPKAFADDHKPVFQCKHELPTPLVKVPLSGQCACDKEADNNLVQGSTIYPPFFKDVRVQLGAPLFIFFALLVMVGSSNAVNLTDGLDGLAAGCTIFVVLVYAILAYVSGRADWSAYLGIPYVPGVGEVAVVCAALAGACAGFLWYNCHPAEIFMGDTGSLPLGGSIGLIALMTKHDLLLVCAGGIFVAEALSVIVQVGYFKMTRKRLLKCAPLHHHFEFSGWKETKVVQRFYIVAAFLALIALTTLKMR